MKRIDPWIYSPKKIRYKVISIILWVILGFLSTVYFTILLIGVFVLIANSLPPEYGKKPYIFHHPAAYQSQLHWIPFGDKVICINTLSNSCRVFDSQKNMNHIKFEHSFSDYYVSDDLLYISCYKNIYVYDTNFEEVARYEVDGGDDLIVKGEYIYYTHWDHNPVKNSIYRYSMRTNQNDYLCEIDSDFINFPSERIYMSRGKYYDYDKVENSMIPSNHDIYSEQYGRVCLETENSEVLINDYSFDFGEKFEVGSMKYSGLDCMLFYTYNPCYDYCNSTVKCISQLKGVKLWKFDYLNNELTMIKEFNDYTILIAFDENNYHYYYDGKLYSNDIEIEKTPFKIEVGNMFIYYASSTAWLNNGKCHISSTDFSYINGIFYYYHYDCPENNKDIVYD